MRGEYGLRDRILTLKRGGELVKYGEAVCKWRVLADAETVLHKLLLVRRLLFRETVLKE